MRVLTPRLPFDAKYVAGPPKRFAQGIIPAEVCERCNDIWSVSRA